MTVTNKTRLFCSLLLACFCLMGAACPSNDTTDSDKIAQTEIFQSLSVKPADEELIATAFFRIGGKTGTTLALVAPSKITFNGQAMAESKNTFSGTFYSLHVPRTVKKGTFVFTDRNGKNYANEIDLASTNWSAKNKTINATQPFAIPFTDRINAAHTNFELEVSGGKNSSQTLLFSGTQAEGNDRANYDAATNAVIIQPGAWQEIPRGPATVKLTISTRPDLQQATRLGGELSFAYELPLLKGALVKTAKKNTPLATPKDSAPQ